jgi:hypothetical protein
MASAAQFQNHTVDIYTSDTLHYRLAPGWSADPLSGVSGKGVSISGDSTLPFTGRIESARIAQIEIQDSETPAILAGTAAVIALLAIWTYTGKH